MWYNQKIVNPFTRARNPMQDCTKIQNEQLRKLVMISQSIATLSENDQIIMINQITELDSEGQQELEKTLLEEQKTIARSQAALAEQRVAHVDKNIALVIQIKQKFDTDASKINEKKEEEQEAQSEENLLKQLE